MTRREREQWLAVGRAWEGPRSRDTQWGLCWTACVLKAVEVEDKLVRFTAGIDSFPYYLAPHGTERGARAMLAYLGSLGALD